MCIPGSSGPCLVSVSMPIVLSFSCNVKINIKINIDIKIDKKIDMNINIDVDMDMDVWDIVWMVWTWNSMDSIGHVA